MRLIAFFFVLLTLFLVLDIFTIKLKRETKSPLHCITGWTDWSECLDGTQSRKEILIKPPMYGGKCDFTAKIDTKVCMQGLKLTGPLELPILNIWSPDFRNNSEFTVAFWVKMDLTSLPNEYFVQLAGNSNQWAITQSNGFSNLNSTISQFSGAGIQGPKDKLSCIVIRYQQTLINPNYPFDFKQILTVYNEDGKFRSEATTSNASQAININQNSKTRFFGGMIEYSDRPGFKGIISEVRAWKKVLTDEQVDLFYNNGVITKKLLGEEVDVYHLDKIIKDPEGNTILLNTANSDTPINTLVNLRQDSEIVTIYN